MIRNFIVTIDGKSYTVGVEEIGATAGTSAPAQSVAPAPAAASVPIQSAAPAAAPAPAADPSAQPAEGTPVTSPFPGLIKGFLVEEGATVEKDQPVLVLEAMKMDNDITAPCAGKVSFRVAKGTNVESDAVLAVIS